MKNRIGKQNYFIWYMNGQIQNNFVIGMKIKSAGYEMNHDWVQCEDLKLCQKVEQCAFSTTSENGQYTVS